MSIPQSSVKSLAKVLAGPLLCLTLIILLWFGTLSRLADERRVLEANALKSVASLSGAYAQFLTRTIEQMDQIAMQVQYDWRREQGHFDLREFRRQGLLIAPQLITVSILGPDGFPTTSTVNLTTRPSALTRDYFIFHRDNDSPSARVGMPVIWPGNGRARLPFTRRLNLPDGSFGGVVAVSIAASYFSEFYDDVSLGNDGMVAMIDMNGMARTARVGDMLHTQSTPVMREAMRFPAVEGSMRLANGSIFADGKPRYVGWHKLPEYPFIAMVGVSEAEVMAAYRASEGSDYLFAWMGTLVLTAFGTASALMTARLSARTRQVEAVRRTYRLATEGANEGFYMLKPVYDDGALIDLHILDCNERGAAMYNSVRARLLGTSLSTLHPQEEFPALLAAVADATQNGFHEAEVPVSPGGRLDALWLHRRLAATDAGLAMTVRDISESKLHQQQLLRMANQDSLTGLPNRQWLNEALPAAIESAKKRQGMLGLLFIDLDKFKQVNDSAGHHVGDELLRIAAQRMKAALRPGDMVARLGGDEFTVILEPLESEDDARQASRRIGRCLAEPFLIEGAQYTIGASTGITLYPRDGQDADRLLQNADVAMYAAKAEGNGGEHVYQTPREGLGLTEGMSEPALRDAFERSQFFLRLQPRIDVASGAVAAFEAQLCWNHPRHGILSETEVRSHAEAADAVAAFCDIALDLVCESLARWHDMGLRPPVVALRLPACYLNRNPAQSRIAACLMRHGVHSNWLEIGISQSAQALDDSGVAQVQALAALGLRPYLDDFDAGSPLRQLQDLRLRSLKLRMRADAEAEFALLDAVVGMARRLGLATIVAGVDSVEARERLARLHGVLAQGEALGAALTVDAIPGLLRERSGPDVAPGIVEPAGVNSL